GRPAGRAGTVTGAPEQTHRRPDLGTGQRAQEGDVLRLAFGLAGGLEDQREVCDLGARDDRPPTVGTDEAVADVLVSIAPLVPRIEGVVRVDQSYPMGDALGLQLGEHRFDTLRGIERVPRGEEVARVQAQVDVV